MENQPDCKELSDNKTFRDNKEHGYESSEYDECETSGEKKQQLSGWDFSIITFVKLVSVNLWDRGERYLWRVKKGLTRG